MGIKSHHRNGNEWINRLTLRLNMSPKVAIFISFEVDSTSKDTHHSVCTCQSNSFWVIKTPVFAILPSDFGKVIHWTTNALFPFTPYLFTTCTPANRERKSEWDWQCVFIHSFGWYRANKCGKEVSFGMIDADFHFHSCLNNTKVWCVGIYLYGEDYT